MQVLVIFFLAAFVGCFGDECSTSVQSCMAGVLQATTDGTSEYKRCKEVIKAIDCMKTAVESCAGHEDEDKVKSDLEKLKEGKEERCSVQHVLSETNDEIQKCYEANQGYIFDCASKASSEVMEAIGSMAESGDLPDRLKCGLFMKTGECQVERVTEKCGAEAANAAILQLAEAAVEVVDACRNSGIDFGGFGKK